MVEMSLPHESPSKWETPLMRFLFPCALLLVLVSPRSLSAQPPEWHAALQDEGMSLAWRSVGPAAMGGRVTDLAVVESDPRIFYVATATGGLWKTSSGGTKFESIMGEAWTSSVGAVAVAPGNPDHVWAGMGEANARNSASWGDGVYASQDGGKTWAHKGLRETRHIGRIAIHPTNENIVLVAALGNIWADNPERGLYRTEDGGETWSLVLALGTEVGCIDVAFCPSNPDVVLAASYGVRRGANDANDPVVRYHAGSGIWRSTDGGRSFALTTSGLPSVDKGRIGLSFARTDGEVVYAVVESELTGRQPPEADPDGPSNMRPYLGVRTGQRRGGALITEVLSETAAEKAGLKDGDLVTSFGETEVKDSNSLIQEIRKRTAGDKVAVILERDGDGLTLEVTLGEAPIERAAGSLGGQAQNAQTFQGTGASKPAASSAVTMPALPGTV